MWISRALYAPGSMCLEGKPLMDKACVKCGQGLHSAGDCLKVYQKQYVAPEPKLAQLVQIDLNEK